MTKTQISFRLSNLYGSIGGTRDKPLIPWFHCNGPHPSKVATDDLRENNNKKKCQKINAVVCLLSLCQSCPTYWDVHTICTRNSFHGGCHCGLGTVGALLTSEEFLVPPPSMIDLRK